MPVTGERTKQEIQLCCILQAASAAVVVLSGSTAGRDPASVSATCARHQRDSGHLAGLPAAAAGLHSTDHFST